MSKIYTAAALISLTFFAACAGSNDKEYIDKSIIPEGSENTAVQPVTPVLPAENSTVLPANASTVPGVNQVNITPQTNSININPQNTVVTTPVQKASTAATNGKLNPAHGQPGHRCDISVGAPLDSKPAAPAAPAVVTTTKQPAVTMTEVPTQTKTAPGMNPPHGEAGHRCDITVGAPLNSKPAAPATPAVVTPTPAAAPPSLLTPNKSGGDKN